MTLSTMRNSLCAVIDPLQLPIQPYTQGVFATWDSTPHPLSTSTVLDNCGAIHLINSVKHLVPGSFRKATGTDTVEAGTSSLEVLGYGTRRFENVLHGAQGPSTEDLILENVAVVDKFHVNIVSEALL